MFEIVDYFGVVGFGIIEMFVGMVGDFVFVEF